MNVIKRFFSYIEIATKIASSLPFVTGLAYCLYFRRTIDLYGTVLFFAALLLFDMTVTMINNYIDRNEAHKEGYFSRPVMLTMIFVTVIPSALLGLYLAWLYGLAFLLAGLFCFAVGIGYTYGPAPISRSPYGELFSGLTQGLVIPFLVTAINMPELAQLALDGRELIVRLDLAGLFRLGLACAPLILCISNIMLANNVCDLEADRAIRYTMPRHIGRENALRLYAVLYILVYIAIIAAWAFRAIPWPCLLVLWTAIPVYKNIRRFSAKQVKAETFVLSIHNFLFIVVPYALFMYVGALF